MGYVSKFTGPFPYGNLMLLLMTRSLYAVLLGVLCVFSPKTQGAAGPIITEFLTQNSGGLRDFEDDSPDWIEIFNDSPQSQNLGGWYLTDDTNELTKWVFPPTLLNSADYLIVFASGKDLAVNTPQGEEFHTSFRLNSEGGFLALVESDGTTLASVFNYPAQRVNVSYGTGVEVSTTNVLISANPSTQLLVPTDDSLGSSWTSPGF